MAQPLPGLTQEAQWALADLINPTSQFVFSTTTTRTDLIEKMRTNLLLMRPNGLPPDYELVALKTFYSTSEHFTPDLHSTPGSQLGILLHRTMPYCGRTYLCEQCSVSLANSSSPSISDKVDVSGLFVNLPIQRALRTSLTFIPRQAHRNESKEVPMTSLSVQPMELEAFLLLPEEPKIP
ncbi:Alpha-mannosidase 2 [Sparganum proliferum]